jgi:RNase P/RNase MRP subunit POP5
MQKKTKFKVLRPTLREKQRYLVYNINYFDKKIAGYNSAKKGLDRALLDFIGELGYSKAGVMFIKGSGKKGILRVDRKYVDHVKTGLMTVKKVENNAVAVNCAGLSGNINKAKQIYEDLC